MEKLRLERLTPRERSESIVGEKATCTSKTAKRQAFMDALGGAVESKATKRPLDRLDRVNRWQVGRSPVSW